MAKRMWLPAVSIGTTSKTKGENMESLKSYLKSIKIRKKEKNEEEGMEDWLEVRCYFWFSVTLSRCSQKISALAACCCLSILLELKFSHMYFDWKHIALCVRMKWCYELSVLCFWSKLYYHFFHWGIASKYCTEYFYKKSSWYWAFALFFTFQLLIIVHYS